MPIQLVDTNIISELARQRPNPGVVAWASVQTSMALSVVTVEEIYYGLAWRPNQRISDWFDEFLSTRCQVLPVSAQVAKLCGGLRGRLAARGIVRTQADLLIAATAQLHQVTLVTRNVGDFQECAIPLLNPFS